MTYPIPQTKLINDTFNACERLTCLGEWLHTYQTEDARLAARVRQLDPKKPLDVQRGAQIANLRRRLRLQLVREPLEVSTDAIDTIGYPKLRQHLVEQFAGFSKADKLLWLNNFTFIMTPDIRELNEKITRVRNFRKQAGGQNRDFLLGGLSGMGKTTYLNWYTSNFIPIVEPERNYVPIIKIDAPVTNHTPKPLLQRIILECGLTYLRGDNEEDLLMKLKLYFQQCGVEMLIIDEVEHIVRSDLRRRILEISNETHGVPIVCASCNPISWTAGDSEVQGRWNDFFELHQYTNTRLSAILAFIELILPFTKDSMLPQYEIRTGSKPSDKIDGPARLIEKWTGGILREIMILIVDASMRAIKEDQPCLTPTLLEASWKDIKKHQPVDFLPVSEKGK
jgi:hypothetical protein